MGHGPFPPPAGTSSWADLLSQTPCPSEGRDAGGVRASWANRLPANQAHFHAEPTSSVIPCAMAWLCPPRVSPCLHPPPSRSPCPRSGFAPGRQRPRFPMVCAAGNTIPEWGLWAWLCWSWLCPAAAEGRGQGRLRAAPGSDAPGEPQPCGTAPYEPQTTHAGRNVL